MNTLFEHIIGFLAAFFFFDLSFGMLENTSLPFIVVWLIIGAIYLTFRFGFINVRVFRHAFDILIGKYKTPQDKGEISSFQSLTTALSATVGLGNIAGVAIAISVGGPGATFWMIVAGFFGMSVKFSEATLAQIYRQTRPDGKIMGGGMQYLSKGLEAKGYLKLGKVLAIAFAIFTIGGSLGAGNVFQASQVMGALTPYVPTLQTNPIIFGLVLGGIIGFVIIGGLKRIATTAAKIVPFMAIVYLTISLWIIGVHASEIPNAVMLIVSEAFNPTAATGGAIGVILVGFQRAVFSSEAGIGSAAIVHATATVKYPVRQGFVALYEPFIDTIVICTITALVIILTGVYDPNGAYQELIAANQGAALTSAAHASVVWWFPWVLNVVIVLFAFSTMIAWSYYGERSWTYLFGERYTLLYKLIFIGFTILASLTSAKILLDFSDLLLLAMALPNLIGIYILRGDIAKELKSYMAKLKSGELEKERIKE
ncbi:MAG TPA: alanine:cation symporter family protein [Epsilonproteobacteria bacterium]|nr:alanine:cation symporter family protein [Campylobacterota bacterium]